MRITRFETFLCSYAFPEEHTWWGGSWDQDGKAVRFHAIILRVHTDEGLTGLGEATPWGDCRAMEAAIHRLEPRFIGRNPFDVEKLTVHGPDGLVNQALAPVDCALWDIVGKATGTPVYRLLAKDGDFQPRHIRTYASGGLSYNWFGKENAIFDEIAAYKAQGFTGMKMRIGSAWGASGVTMQRFGDHLTKIRAALGDDMDLMLDANGRFRSVAEALEVCHILEGLRARWFEEPVHIHRASGPADYAAIRAQTTVPISGGEVVHSVSEHRALLQAGAYGIVQPDATFMGLTGAYRVAQMYHQVGLPCIPHSWTNAIAQAANAHLVAAIPNRVMLETQQIHNVMLTELADNPIPVNQGTIDVPERPGLGIELNEEAVKRHPFTENGITIPWPR
jgi:L-alanine-DL-glutamate epimerase-like enolase superfamily enzyme